MTTLATPISLTDIPQHVVLYDVSYELYKRLLGEVGEQHIRMNFDRGTLEIMSPLSKHEKWKKIIARMIELLSLERSIPVGSLGSTTFAHDELEKGLEPDECYYVQNEPAVRNKDRINLPEDPPPDLVVEIDITHRAVNREAIYAAMGVPEIWRFGRKRLESLHLNATGTYEPKPASRAFPFLQIADVERFLQMLPERSEHEMMLAWRDWLRRLP